jgi:signal transduction histidine kinase
MRRKLKYGRNTSHVEPKNLQLLQLAAHDLRNPVSGILAASQYLIEDGARAFEPHQLTVLRSIESSARSMLRLLEEMVEISSIGAGGAAQLNLRYTDLGALVEHVVSINRSLADGERVSLELKVDGEVPALITDPAKLTNALEGLLVNAIRSSRAGGLVEVVVGSQGKNITIRVREDGQNNSTGALRSLFHTPEPARPRRGLAAERAARALANAKHIVEAHHGAIRVETRADHRPEVLLMLPIPTGGARRAQKVFKSAGS